MLSYLLEYAVICIGICCHMHWNMLSYALEYVVLFIGICCPIYWNMLSYLLEYIIIFSVICYIYYNMSSYLFIVIYIATIQTITSVKFLGGISPNNSKNIDIYTKDLRDFQYS